MNTKKPLLGGASSRPNLGSVLREVAGRPVSAQGQPSPYIKVTVSVAGGLFARSDRHDRTGPPRKDIFHFLLAAADQGHDVVFYNRPALLDDHKLDAALERIGIERLERKKLLDARFFAVSDDSRANETVHLAIDDDMTHYSGLQFYCHMHPDDERLQSFMRQYLESPAQDLFLLLKTSGLDWPGSGPGFEARIA